jgi:hypothetical protein
MCDNLTKQQLDHDRSTKTRSTKRQLDQNQLDQENYFEAEISHTLLLASRVKYKPTSLQRIDS